MLSRDLSGCRKRKKRESARKRRKIQDLKSNLISIPFVSNIVLRSCGYGFLVPKIYFGTATHIQYSVYVYSITKLLYITTYICARKVVYVCIKRAGVVYAIVCVYCILYKCRYMRRCLSDSTSKRQLAKLVSTYHLQISYIQIYVVYLRYAFTFL